MKLLLKDLKWKNYMWLGPQLSKLIQVHHTLFLSLSRTHARPHAHKPHTPMLKQHELWMHKQTLIL